MRSSVYNTKNLLLFNLKKDKKKTIIWLLSLIGLVFIIAMYFKNVPMEDGERELFIETMKNPAITLICGLFPTVKASIGLMFAIEMTLFTAIIVGIMNIFFVASNTRSDEEEGRLELIRSLPTGRLATLLASLLQMLIINIMLAVGIGIFLSISGIGENPIYEAFHFGFIMGTFGFLSATITSLFVQLFASNRTAITATFSCIGFLFLLRGMTDIYNPNLSWLSPVAWVYKATPYIEINWIPVLMMFILSIVIISIALYLNSLRDLGGSFVKAKKGKTNASKLLATPTGLSLHLNKTTIISWTISIILTAATFGIVFTDFEKFLSNNSFLKNVLGNSDVNLMNRFVVMILELNFILITIPLLLIVGRIYSEEKKNNVDSILSKKVSRKKLLSSYLIPSIVFGIILTILSAITIYFTSNGVVDLIFVIKMSVQFLFATLLILGIGVLLIGLKPKLYNFIWLLVGYSFFVSYFSEMLKLPEWLKDISPFYHIVKDGGETFSLISSLIMGTMTIILIIYGFISYNKRDINI